VLVQLDEVGELVKVGVGLATTVVVDEAAVNPVQLFAFV
jgi:hypothetical protein